MQFFTEKLNISVQAPDNWENYLAFETKEGNAILSWDVKLADFAVLVTFEIDHISVDQFSNNSTVVIQGHGSEISLQDFLELKGDIDYVINSVKVTRKEE